MNSIIKQGVLLLLLFTPAANSARRKQEQRPDLAQLEEGLKFLEKEHEPDIKESEAIMEKERKKGEEALDKNMSHISEGELRAKLRDMIKDFSISKKPSLYKIFRKVCLELSQDDVRVQELSE